MTPLPCTTCSCPRKAPMQMIRLVYISSETFLQIMYKKGSICVQKLFNVKVGVYIYIYIFLIIYIILKSCPLQSSQALNYFVYSCIYTCIYKFIFKMLLSLNNTVCDNYTNSTNKHVTKRTQNQHFQVNMLGIPCLQF